MLQEARLNPQEPAHSRGDTDPLSGPHVLFCIDASSIGIEGSSGVLVPGDILVHQLDHSRLPQKEQSVLGKARVSQPRTEEKLLQTKALI